MLRAMAMGLVAIGILSLGLIVLVLTAWADNPKPVEVAASVKEGKSMSGKTETATFAAGCFWGAESTFRKTPGVIKTTVGYTGGTMKDPTYKDVCTDETGHAEAVEVVFDPEQVSYQKLLEVFFENHDPTTVNRQGPDFGTQYRSAVFFHSPEQEKAAKAEIKKRNDSKEYVGPIVTQVVEAGTFYEAEKYHQQYFEKKGVDYVCHLGNGKKK